MRSACAVLVRLFIRGKGIKGGVSQKVPSEPPIFCQGLSARLVLNTKRRHVESAVCSACEAWVFVVHTQNQIKTSKGVGQKASNETPKLCQRLSARLLIIQKGKEAVVDLKVPIQRVQQSKAV